MRHLKYRAIAGGVAVVVSSLAHAQSSVTLYGTLDEAVAYYNNAGGHSVVEMQSGDNAASYWGLKGSEDLGGGLKTVFTLESSFNITNGQLSGNRIFAHQSFVGIAKDSLGTLTMGRQFDPTVDLVQPITGDAIGGPVFTTPGDADNNDDTVWINSSVKYASPTYAGFQYELMYGFGGLAGNTTGGQSYSAAAAYNNGGLTLATGYLFSKNDVNGNGAADLTQNNSVTPLYDSTPMFGSRQIFQAAAQYVIGSLTANVRYSNAQYKPYTNYGAFNRTETFNIGAAAMQYQFNPAFSAGLSYVYTRSSGASSATYNTLGANGIYTLSKRTSLYAAAGYSHASGTTFSADGSAIVAAGGTIGDLTSSSSNRTQATAILGITHKF
ncbi:porin [Paraburkholderia phosphatilytica]|uniref:porin n=1 Tax=Paraburkholderia phosphatilytica TaxID=2282883 RepID=UPI0013DE8FBC|nr:porin [Paraburkholderia phosphatilytica]